MHKYTKTVTEYSRGYFEGTHTETLETELSFVELISTLVDRSVDTITDSEKREKFAEELRFNGDNFEIDLENQWCEYSEIEGDTQIRIQFIS